MFILCKNIQGRSVLAISQAHCLLDANVFDLIIYLETWFSNWNVWHSDPYILAFSDIPPLPATGHRPGGILVLCKPTMKNQYHVIHTTMHSISIQHHTGNILTFSYYPPSLGGTAYNMTLIRFHHQTFGWEISIFESVPRITTRPLPIRHEATLFINCQQHGTRCDWISNQQCQTTSIKSNHWCSK
jgi:hypothetical protein